MFGKILRRKQNNKKPEVVIPRRHSTFKLPETKKKRRINISFNASRAKTYTVGAVVLLLIIGILFGLYTLITSPTFAVTEFSFNGNSKATTAELGKVMDSWKGQNIFLLRTGEIKDKLLESNFFFEAVSIKKIWPNKLKISISESRPELSLINLSGAYLITKNGLVLEVVSKDRLNFNEQELDIIKGFGSPNARYVEERMRLDAGLPPEPETSVTPTPKGRQEVAGTTSKPDEFNFTAIEQAKKIEVLNVIRSELLSKVQETWSKYNELISQKEFAALPRVFAYDNNGYEEKDSLSLSRLEVTNEVLGFFNGKNNLIVERIIWESDYLINIQLTTSQNIIFGINRKASEQLEDLQLILEHLRISGESYSKIDLSSRKVSVTISN